MSASFFDDGLSTAVSHLVNSFPETLEKIVNGDRGRHYRPHHRHGQRKGLAGDFDAAAAPVDILETPRAYTFFLDVPGLSKSDIQVTLEDEAVLVIASVGNGKRKREDGKEGEGECKYLLLERRAAPKFQRRFCLPEDSDAAAISAKCENGVLTVTVQKRPPPPQEETKPKTVTVTVQ